MKIVDASAAASGAESAEIRRKRDVVERERVVDMGSRVPGRVRRTHTERARAQPAWISGEADTDPRSPLGTCLIPTSSWAQQLALEPGIRRPALRLLHMAVTWYTSPASVEAQPLDIGFPLAAEAWSPARRRNGCVLEEVLATLVFVVTIACTGRSSYCSSFRVDPDSLSVAGVLLAGGEQPATKRRFSARLNPYFTRAGQLGHEPFPGQGR